MDKSITPTKPRSSRQDAMDVLSQLRKGGFIAYFAGGCVRDQLLGLQPKDFDIATNATPKQVQEQFSNTQAVGAAFGVILVRRRQSVIEVATFRSDASYQDGRHPSAVHFSTPQEDAQRRDFTINGLFFDPLEDRVIDFVGGQADLSNHLLRAIGEADERFAEDHLRLLRAMRFASRFNLTIEPKTAEAIVRHAKSLIRISPERIAEELRMMLTPPTRAGAWPRLWEFGLLEPIFRFGPPPTAQNRKFNPARSIFLAVSPDDVIDFPLALAAGSLCYQSHESPANADFQMLLSDPFARKLVRAVRQSLKISNEETDRMEVILRGVGGLLQDAMPSVAQLKRFYAHPTAPDAIRLLLALQQMGVRADRIGWLRERFSELESVDCAPIPLISGEDLLAAGLSAGPQFKRILYEVYDAQLEGRVQDKSEAMGLALKLAGGH
ncbi:MAG: CCA tRNA nucleotidyltransferase [Phycisphaerales bacterium]|jgi:tRNA nucleotidyltransferase/poly(A) polymerase|nr:CCA tRNA nucleotidyltransferase [Phycisphaerales bacterium]